MTRTHLNIIILVAILIAGVIFRFLADESQLQYFAALSGLAFPTMFFMMLLARRREKKEEKRLQKELSHLENQGLKSAP